MELSKLLRYLRIIGWKQAIQTARFSLYRDRLDLAAQPQDWRHVEFQPGRLIETTSLPDGAIFTFKNAGLEIRFLAEDLVRLTWNPAERADLSAFPSLLQRRDWEPISSHYKETELGPQISSQALGVLVQDDGKVGYVSKHGITLREDNPPTFFKDKVNGMEAGWIHKAQLKPDASIYGLGERSTSLDRRGSQFEMWNSDPGGTYGPGIDPLYLCIPVYQVQQLDGGFLIFYENSCRATFEFSEYASVHFQDGPLRFYFIPGNPSQTIERFSELTGRPKIPPIWVLGYHQSRWGYKSEDEIRNLAAGFKQHNLPVSCFHLDIDYMQGYRVFTINKENFPDMAGLAYDLAQDGIRVVSILDPGVKIDKRYSIYQSGLENDVFCRDKKGRNVRGLAWPGWTAFPDFTKPSSRHWWGEQYNGLLERGISGFWHDMNEPASFSAWGELTLPLTTQHDMEGIPSDHRHAHNLYGLGMAKAGFEGLQRLQPQRRPWILSRSGWAGIQQYAWSWTGDTETSWDALRMTIPCVLGLGLSGQPYCGPDIGGFDGNPDGELYTRWFQMATFLPFFRTHSAVETQRREPWVFGEPVTSIIRKFLQLRYRLTPYFYTLAWESAQKGYPLVRPLFWLEPENSRFWQVDDAFLLGDDLLIAPVLEAGANTRQVSLPNNCWYDFWDDSLMEGPGKAIIPAILETIPIFVRDGSLIPMELEGGLELHLYPQESSRAGGNLYSDAGDGFGPYRLDRFTIERGQKQIAIQWQSTGDYPFPYDEVSLQVHGNLCKSINLDGQDLKSSNNIFKTGIFHQALINFE